MNRERDGRRRSLVPRDKIEYLIFEVRGQRVMLDADLATIYGVQTKRLNEQVKRNIKRFPTDFLFQLTGEEVEALRCQIGISNLKSHFATSSGGHGGRRKLPYAFTEHGAVMVANVLNSARAVQMSVFVVRALVRMRAALGGTRELARKLAVLEKELKSRLDLHEATIVTILQRVMDVIDPPALPAPPRRHVGFVR